GMLTNTTSQTIFTEVLVPAGYVTTVYDPVFQLTPDGRRYVSKPSDRSTRIPPQGYRSHSCFVLTPVKRTFSSVLLRPTRRPQSGVPCALIMPTCSRRSRTSICGGAKSAIPERRCGDRQERAQVGGGRMISVEQMDGT